MDHFETNNKKPSLWLQNKIEKIKIEIQKYKNEMYYINSKELEDPLSFFNEQSDKLKVYSSESAKISEMEFEIKDFINDLSLWEKTYNVFIDNIKSLESFIKRIKNKEVFIPETNSIKLKC